MLTLPNGNIINFDHVHRELDPILCRPKSTCMHYKTNQFTSPPNVRQQKNLWKTSAALDHHLIQKKSSEVRRKGGKEKGKVQVKYPAPLIVRRRSSLLQSYLQRHIPLLSLKKEGKKKTT